MLFIKKDELTKILELNLVLTSVRQETATPQILSIHRDGTVLTTGFGITPTPQAGILFTTTPRKEVGNTETSQTPTSPS